MSRTPRQQNEACKELEIVITDMAIYTRLNAVELETILAPYHIEVKSFAPVVGGNANSNYRIHGSDGEYMLTIMEEKSLPEVQKLATLIQWLGEHRFLTPPVYPTATGEMVTQYAGKPVMVKKWIYGDVHEELNADKLRQIGSAMARLHQIPAPDYLAKLPPYGDEFFSIVIGYGKDAMFESWLDDRLRFFKENVPGKLPRGLIHGDVFFDNVLFENDQIKAIIDFEEVRNYYLISDLGMGVIGLCISEKKIDLTKVRNLVMGYERIRPLDILEKESLKLFIEYAAVATSCWRYWKYNIYSSSLDLRNRHLEMFNIAENMILLANDDFMQFVFE